MDWLRYDAPVPFFFLWKFIKEYFKKLIFPQNVIKCNQYKSISITNLKSLKYYHLKKYMIKADQPLNEWFLSLLPYKVTCPVINQLRENCIVRSSSFTNFYIHSERKFHCYPTLTPSQGLKNCFFIMKIFLQAHLYVNNVYAKFQGQKIHPKKDIQSLPTCVAVNFHCC